MAVPTGEYEVEAGADLGPLFGVVKDRVRLRIEQPGPDALEKLIARLGNPHAPDREDLVTQLGLFPDAGERVVPLLLEIADREDDRARFDAVYALMEFPDQAEEMRDTLLGLIETKEPIGGAAAVVLGSLYPKLLRLTHTYQEARYDGRSSLADAAARAIRRYFGE